MEIKEILRKSYNNFADQREQNKMQEWKIQLRNSFLNLLMEENKSSLLDIGAGTGKDSKFFMDNNINVMAVDLSDEMVKLCKKRN